MIFFRVIVFEMSDRFISNVYEFLQLSDNHVKYIRRTIHCFRENLDRYLRRGKNDWALLCLVELLAAATKDQRINIDGLAVKVGSGVFVIYEDIYQTIMSDDRCVEVIDQLYTAHGVDLFGARSCECNTPCRAARCFLGKYQCSTVTQKMMLLKEVLPNRDVLSLIVCEIVHK